MDYIPGCLIVFIAVFAGDIEPDGILGGFGEEHWPGFKSPLAFMELLAL
jgi:hypothetical protein